MNTKQITRSTHSNCTPSTNITIAPLLASGMGLDLSEQMECTQMSKSLFTTKGCCQVQRDLQVPTNQQATAPQAWLCSSIDVLCASV